MTSYHFDPGNARDIVADGPWFRDALGRFALFRGINFGARSKLPPYLPVLPLDVQELTPKGIERFRQELHAVRPHLDLLKQLGFNVVRLVVIWKALEPRPNPHPERLLPEGEQYLELVRDVIDALYARGLFVFLDFHQDIAHEFYGGDGFPDWALATDRRRGPPRVSSRAPDSRWGTSYYRVPVLQRMIGLGKTSAGVRQTLRAFWRNNLSNAYGLMNYPVRTHLVTTIGATARFFQAQRGGQGHPALLGYEPFNEPHPVGIDKQEFEAQVLPQFYREVLAAIRNPSAGLDGDKRAFLFIEPRMDWTTYAADGPEYHGTHFTRAPETYLPTSLLDARDQLPERVVFSFHYYDPWITLSAHLPVVHRTDPMRRAVRDWPATFRRLRDAATSRGLVPFLSEFGGNHDWARLRTELRPSMYYGDVGRAYIDLQFQQVEAQLLNATYWVYDLYNTADGQDNWNHEDFSLLGPNRVARNLDVVARPYPMRSSAEPSLLSFDLATRQCAIILHGPVVAAPTVIYVPRAIHHQDGFVVLATSADVEWDADNQLLYWHPDPAQPQNQLIVSPLRALDERALPARSRALLSSTPVRMRWPDVPDP